MNTNQMKQEMLVRLETNAEQAKRMLTVLAALDRVGDTGDFDLQDQLVNMDETLQKLRDTVTRSMSVVPTSGTYSAD